MNSTEREFSKAAVGGTFDRLHKGHRNLLHRAFEVAEEVIIGVTSNHFTQKKQLAESLQPYSLRKELLEKWLQENCYQNRYQLIKLDDTYGTTLTDAQLQALIVTPETHKTGQKINRLRRKKGLPKLALITQDLIQTEDHSQIQSKRIRQGQINTTGDVYAQVFAKPIHLTNQQRLGLKMPMDILIDEQELGQRLLQIQPIRTTIIGDATLKHCLENDIAFDVGVFDGHTHRDIPFTLELPDYPQFKVENAPGQINPATISTFRQAFKQRPSLIKVDGEEDLLTLVAVMESPLESVVCYGQPNQGIVIVRVSEANKERWYRFLRDTDRM